MKIFENPWLPPKLIKFQFSLLAGKECIEIKYSLKICITRLFNILEKELSVDLNLKFTQQIEAINVLFPIFVQKMLNAWASVPQSTRPTSVGITWRPWIAQEPPFEIPPSKMWTLFVAFLILLWSPPHRSISMFPWKLIWVWLGIPRGQERCIRFIRKHWARLGSRAHRT